MLDRVNTPLDFRVCCQYRKIGDIALYLFQNFTVLILVLVPWQLNFANVNVLYILLLVVFTVRFVPGFGLFIKILS